MRKPGYADAVLAYNDRSLNDSGADYFGDFKEGNPDLADFADDEAYYDFLASYKGPGDTSSLHAAFANFLRGKRNRLRGEKTRYRQGQQADMHPILKGRPGRPSPAERER